MEDSELTVSERIAMITWRLCAGGRISAPAAARYLECSQRNAQKILLAISRVIPIYRDEDGIWQRLEISG